MNERILIVEDDDTLRLTLHEFLSQQGFDTHSAATAETGLQLVQQQPFHLALIDLQLPGISGLDMIKMMTGSGDDTVKVVMTANPQVGTAISTLKAGAYDYLSKPFDLAELLALVARAMELRQLRHEVAWRRVHSEGRSDDRMVGSSPAFLNLTATTERIAAAARVPVLILGESGTGKEHVAKSIHRLSERASGPWVTVNCSALPEGLLESEMFGHEKGSFTDARQARKGLLELADGGTLFLDEIGDMSLALQPKLLRAIETQTFRRLGSQKETQVNVRFVAATHRNLPEMVAQGTFRQDLYYRLNVGTIEVPPLRDRREDIIGLAEHFMFSFAPTIGCASQGLSEEVRRCFEAYHWPGNIRELRNLIERALILCSDKMIGAAQLPREMLNLVAEPNLVTQAIETPGDGRCHAACSVDRELTDLSLASATTRHIERVLARCDGNKTRAAELLGISRLTLRSRLLAIGLAVEE